MPIHLAHGFPARARVHFIEPLVAFRLTRLLLRLCVLQIVPGSPRRDTVAAARRGTAAVIARTELGLLGAAVTQERAQGDNIGHGCGGEQRYRRPHGAEYLVALELDDLGHRVQGDAHGQEAEAEEHDQQDLALRGNARGQDDGHRKDDEDNVNHGAGGPHGDELHEALSALAAWVGRHLPVFGNGVALGEIGNEDGNKGYAKSISKKHGKA